MCSTCTTTFEQRPTMNGISSCEFYSKQEIVYARVIMKLKMTYITEEQLRLLVNSPWCYLKEDLNSYLENLTIVSLFYSETPAKCRDLKSFQSCPIKNELDDLRVERDSKNNSIVLDIYPTHALLRFHVSKSHGYVEIQAVSYSDASNIEITKKNFQCLCKNSSSHLAIVSNMTEKSQLQTHATGNAFPETEIFPLSHSCTPSSSSSVGQCLPRFTDQSTQTEEKCAVESEGTQIFLAQILEGTKSEIVFLKEFVRSLRLKLERSEGSLVVTEIEHKKEVDKLLKENKLLNNKLVTLENKLRRTQTNMNVTSLQLEHDSVECDKLINEERKGETLNKPLVASSSHHITSLNPLLEPSLIPCEETSKESRLHKSSSRELKRFDNEFLGPGRQKIKNFPASTLCEKNGTVPHDNGSHHKLEGMTDGTRIANNKANSSSNLQDCLTCCSPSSQAEDKQRSDANKPSKSECVNMTVNSRPQDSNIAHQDDEVWLCHHYKRRCFVKFSCCKTFWPCHRCHNNKSKCGVKRLKSCDTQWIKCASCDTEQLFAKHSQYCTKCHKKFSEFFCATCKHLTGMDDNPYHCDKCGICRIHGNRSFHCDICGVCLDVQLQGKHKCRDGSAHDECCICLEDAFSGCQILPCSHKVHKECATKMIRSGVTCCPICRESFAHKLQKKVSSKN